MCRRELPHAIPRIDTTTDSTTACPSFSYVKMAYIFLTVYSLFYSQLGFRFVRDRETTTRIGFCSCVMGSWTRRGKCYSFGYYGLFLLVLWSFIFKGPLTDAYENDTMDCVFVRAGTFY